MNTKNAHPYQQGAFRITQEVVVKWKQAHLSEASIMGIAINAYKSDDSDMTDEVKELDRIYREYQGYTDTIISKQYMGKLWYFVVQKNNGKHRHPSRLRKTLIKVKSINNIAKNVRKHHGEYIGDNK